MSFIAKPGKSLLMPINRMYQTAHLWVILTSPQGDPLKVVIVNVTTKRSHSDNTVILNTCDHPFIHHPSVVNYADARFINVDKLKRTIDLGFAEERESFSELVLNKIKEGIFKSPRTPQKIKTYCNLHSF